MIKQMRLAALGLASGKLLKEKNKIYLLKGPEKSTSLRYWVIDDRNQGENVPVYFFRTLAEAYIVYKKLTKA